MTTHTAYVQMLPVELDRINRLLAIESLEDLTDAQLREHGANTDVCEGIFYVEFDNGATLNLDLCSGSHNYYDDMVWTSPCGKHDITLDCEYELDDDIEVEIDNELYVVKIFHDDKFRVRCTDNADEEAILVFDTEEEANSFIERELTQCKDLCRDQNYDYADWGNPTKFWLCDEINWVEWIRLWK